MTCLLLIVLLSNCTGPTILQHYSTTLFYNSLSVRILHCAPPPRLQVDPHYLTQKMVADPKMRCNQNSFGIWRVTEVILGKKRVFQKTYFEKIKNKSHYFFSFFRYTFCRY